MRSQGEHRLPGLCYPHDGREHALVYYFRSLEDVQNLIDLLSSGEKPMCSGPAEGMR